MKENNELTERDKNFILRSGYRSMMHILILVFVIYHFWDEIWEGIGAILSLSILKGW